MFLFVFFFINLLLHVLILNIDNVPVVPTIILLRIFSRNKVMLTRHH